MDIYQILKQDHREVEGIVGRILNGREPARDEAFSKLLHQLQAHMDFEEYYLYPALQRSEDAREDVLEAIEEHALAKKLMDEAGRTASSDERWGAKLKVLGDVLAHHIKEEEGTLFKKAHKLVPPEMAQRMVEQYERIRQKHLAMQNAKADKVLVDC